jgi:hypothetical protein
LLFVALQTGSIVLIAFSVVTGLGGIVAVTFFLIKRMRRRGYEKISTNDI